MRHVILNIISLFFTGYYMMLVIRIAGSWFPSFSYSKIMRFISRYTDPFLNIFRKIIPPIGGMLDLSPLLAFFSLKIIQSFILNLCK